MTIRDLSPRALDASAQIDRLAGALASATAHDGEDELDALIADALRAVTQLVDADYAMLENEGTGAARGWRHVWSRPGAIVGREPRVSVPVTQKGRASCEFSVGVREPGADLPPAIMDALRGLAHVMVLLLEREHASRRSSLAGQAPHVSMAPVWQASDNCSADEFENIIGDSPALRRAMFRVQQVAPTDASVMLLGETGTGKELFARAIHNRSVRSGKPFVKVNCAALPSTLIETELFGHVRGAFTGAVAMRQGRFEIADGGTLFLDEIGDLPADVQAKLLRVLQEGEFERVGSSQSRRVDVRIVAATHHDLDAAMTEGRFRADLYYRLNVFPIVLPPLRQRTEDIPRLVWYFVNRRQRALNRKFTTIPVSVYASLQERPWPGNVRELQNVIERAMIHSTGNMLSLDETPSSLPPVTARGTATLEDVERQYVQDALQRCRWRINGRGNAAETLGLHPNTLRNRMKKFGIQRPQPASTRLTA
jgi:transcriptional regulator with GAF, ATPase, and Fis domain